MYTVHRYQLELEQDVGEYNRMKTQLELQHGCSDKETSRLSDNIASKRSSIDRILRSVEMWRKIGRMPGFVLSDQEKADMLQTGQVPVTFIQGNAAGKARNLYYGKLYYTTEANRDRAAEEINLLMLEFLRLHEWVEHMRKECLALLQTEEQVGKVPDIRALVGKPAAEIVKAFARAPASVGKQFWLRKHIRMLDGMHADVVQSMTLCLPQHIQSPVLDSTIV
jgi:hypothetical protein